MVSLQIAVDCELEASSACRYHPCDNDKILMLSRDETFTRPAYFAYNFLMFYLPGEMTWWSERGERQIQPTALRTLFFKACVYTRVCRCFASI